MLRYFAMLNSAQTLTERLRGAYASAVHDVLRAMGHSNCVLPPDIRALDPAHKLAGEIYTVNGRYNTGLDAHETLLQWTGLLSKAPAGKVIICQPNTREIALMGELSAETLQHKGVLGYIADGGCRDVDFILKLGFPVFCSFFTPKDIVARWVPESFGQPITIGGVRIESGDYVLADRDGVVIIPRGIAATVVNETEAVMQKENKVRSAILGGMDPQEAYRRFGKF